ncbi:hypothetical protein T492DRAFT_972967, partial [Pavlovales sp. CCMP2436]
AGSVTLERLAYAARHERRPYGAGPPRDRRSPSFVRRRTCAGEPRPPLRAAAADGRRASSTSLMKKGCARTSQSEVSEDRETKKGMYRRFARSLKQAIARCRASPPARVIALRAGGRRAARQGARKVRLAVPIAGRVLSKYAIARALRRRFRPRVVCSSAWTGSTVSFRHKLELRRSEISFQRREESSCDFDALR